MEDSGFQEFEIARLDGEEQTNLKKLLSEVILQGHVIREFQQKVREVREQLEEEDWDERCNRIGLLATLEVKVTADEVCTQMIGLLQSLKNLTKEMVLISESLVTKKK